MENKPAFDRGLIPPIVFGAFSLFGICLVLLVIRLSSFRAPPAVEKTNTPFQYLLIGTEPGFTTLTPEDEPTVEEEPTVENEPTAKATPTPRRTASPTKRVTTTNSGDDIISLASPTRTRPPINTSASTPTTASTAPLNPGVYDDTDARIIYNGDWTQTKVNNVTLHVSNTLNNSITIRFIGDQIRIFYQEGPSLGTILINIDGQEFEQDESADNVAQAEWVSVTLLNGTHTVTITHLSGGSINLDAFAVPDPIKTATPTP